MESEHESGVILDIDEPAAALARALKMAEADVWRAMADLARRIAAATRAA